MSFANLSETTDNKAIRELRDEVKNLNKSTKRLNIIMVILSMFMIALTFVLVWQGLK